MRGSFWLTPTGVVSSAGVEHGYLAKLAMLGLERGSPEAHKYVPMPRWHHPLTDHAADELLKRGAAPGAISFLAQDKDPRLYAIREWGWVRVRDDHIDVWTFDQPTLDMIRNSIGFWEAVQGYLVPGARFVVSEESTGNLFTVEAKRLLSRATDPEALKAHAMGVGKYRNPPGPASSEKIAEAFEAAGYPFTRIVVEDDCVMVFEHGDGDVAHLALSLTGSRQTWGYDEWRALAASLMEGRTS